MPLSEVLGKVGKVWEFDENWGVAIPLLKQDSIHSGREIV